MTDRTSRVIAWCSTRTGLATSTLVIVALAAWFAVPALFIPYSEGFQPQVVLNAHALGTGDLPLGDPVYPFNARLFLLTRLGMTLAVAGLQHAIGASGLAAFRLLGLVSLALLLSTVLALLWRVYRVRPALALLCCVLFPPVFESGYLPNDNMPSAALVCLALWVFWSNPTLLRTAVTGSLLGLAVLVRPDAAFIAPAFGILLLTEVEGWGARAVRAVVAGVLALVVPFLVYRLCGLSFLDTFAAANKALLLWQRPQRPLYNDVRTLLRSVSAPGMVAWLLGVAAFARLRHWRELALAVIVPLLYVAAYRSQLVEGRYLLPLTPFVLLPMAAGLRSMATLPRRGSMAALAGLAAGLALWIVPPWPGLKGSLAADDEGPRLMLGRAWNPLPTLWWQDRLRQGQAAVAEGIERVAAAPDPVIVTGYWTGDRLTALLLQEHGFAVRPGAVPQACQGVAESWVRGPLSLLLVRTHIPFLHQNESVTWEAAGLPCVQAARPQGAPVLVVNSGNLDRPTAAGDAAGAVFSAAGGAPPPLAPRMVSELPGISTAFVPLKGVQATLEPPYSAEERETAMRAVVDRLVLLR